MITERLMGVGRWEIRLDDNTPANILEILNPERSGMGNIVITPEHMDAAQEDVLLASARYTGPLRKRREGTRISGCGSNYWFVGDEDKKGPFISSMTTANGYFSQWVTLLRRPWLSAGITSTIPTSNPFAKTYPRGPVAEVIAELDEYWGLEWRVTPDWKLDWGFPSDLFGTTPVAMIRRRAEEAGRELNNIIGIVGKLEVSEDIEDYARTVNYTYDSTSHVLADGGIPAIDIPFRTPIGTEVSIARFITESGDNPAGTEVGLANAAWAKTSKVRREFSLQADHYDIGAEVKVGDAVDVYDPDRGLFDMSRPRQYRGETLYPVAIRCLGYTYPVVKGMGVYFRRHRKVGASWVLEWTDLTPFVKWDKGTARVDVGAVPRVFARATPGYRRSQ